MNTWLYLTAQGLADPSPDWPCCLLREDGQQQPATLAEAARTLAAQPVRLLLPMEMCSWFRTEKWPSRRQPSVQAIGFAIEEQLGEELDALHLCPGRRDPQGRYPVLVIHKELFNDLLDLLAAVGIEVSAIHVDADLLPSDQLDAVWWFGRWLLGGALDARLAVPAEALVTLRPLLGATVCGPGEGSNSWLPGPADHAINLLQGEHRQAGQRWPWATTCLSGAVLFVLSWGFTEARSVHYEQEARQLYAQSVERFQALYPEQTRIVDLPAQLKAVQGSDAAEHTTQISRLVSVTDQVIGASSVEVQQIEFRAGEGWKIQLTASSFAQLEQLRERGQQSGLPIKLGSANKVQEQVQAVLTLEEKS
ncbi:type II secretion system protein GspL [Pseudomonas sp. GD03860]|uniref:type II secretion system protein GspL n=1 Tax=Pseudomonas TaxID=286 RepID=UPI0023649133|nr:MULTISPECIES: type II secretion system protein GspL [Pseudomonas]MDD2058605.1 type II secretion system protein GspL [Pseudomonas putida]MDH0640794.1 type II secretion system protein GspL [Pseudomonas sp. GD03860]